MGVKREGWRARAVLPPTFSRGRLHGEKEKSCVGSFTGEKKDEGIVMAIGNSRAMQGWGRGERLAGAATRRLMKKKG